MAAASTARSTNSWFSARIAGQAVVVAAVADLGLAQEGNEAGLQLRGERGGSLPRAVDRVTALFGAGGGALDLGRALGDGFDEARGVGRAARQFAGRCDL